MKNRTDLCVRVWRTTKRDWPLRRGIGWEVGCVLLERRWGESRAFEEGGTSIRFLNKKKAVLYAPFPTLASQAWLSCMCVVYLRVRRSRVAARDVRFRAGLSVSRSEISDGKLYLWMFSGIYKSTLTMNTTVSFGLYLFSSNVCDSPSSSELLPPLLSSVLFWGLSATSGILTRNFLLSLSTTMLSFPLDFSTRCLVSSRDKFSVVIPLI